MVGSLLSRDPKEAGGATDFPPPGREQLPRIPHQAWGGTQWLDNMLASNPGIHL